MKATLLVFNHLAPHNSQIATPTRDRLKNPATVDRCNAIIDLIFWQGRMYDCQVNKEGCDELFNMLDKVPWYMAQNMLNGPWFFRFHVTKKNKRK